MLAQKMDTEGIFVDLSSDMASLPNSRPGEYHLRLPQPLKITNDYVCAVTDISFERAWSSVSNNDAVIIMDLGGHIDGVKIQAGDYGYTADLVESINAALHEHTSPPSGTLDRLRQNSDFVNFEQRIVARGEVIPDVTTKELKIFYDRTRNRVGVTRDPSRLRSIWFSDTMKKLLGVTHTFEFNQKSTICTESPDPSGGVDKLYVLSNVIKSRHAPGYMAPLMHTVNVYNIKRQYHTIPIPQYFPVSSNSFESISIATVDVHQRVKPVEKLRVQLHFRPRKALLL